MSKCHLYKINWSNKKITRVKTRSFFDKILQETTNKTPAYYANKQIAAIAGIFCDAEEDFIFCKAKSIKVYVNSFKKADEFSYSVNFSEIAEQYKKYSILETFGFHNIKPEWFCSGITKKLFPQDDAGFDFRNFSVSICKTGDIEIKFEISSYSSSSRKHAYGIIKDNFQEKFSIKELKKIKSNYYKNGGK